MLQPELTLAKLRIQLVLLELLLNQMKMFRMLLFILGVGKNVIYEHAVLGMLLSQIFS
jgi:hypothetical protein